MKLKKLFSAVLLASVLTAHAQCEGGIFALTDENDLNANFFGPHQDRHYTHGLKFTWLAADDTWPRTTAWFNQIPQWGIHDAVGKLGFGFGQNIYTPQDILATAPLRNDRPYAGWLYAGMIFERRGTLTPRIAVLESFELDLGLVGPDAFAGEVQRAIHRWRFPEDIPQGWNNQIHDEPGLLLKYGRLWRWSPTECSAKFFDVIPRAGFNLGNVDTSGTAGVTARLGWNLPDDFGVQIIDSPSAVNGGGAERKNNFSVYMFAGADGRLVGRDLTLDGNSARVSQSVKKYDYVNDLSWGIAVQPCAHFELSWVQVTRSKEFSGQQRKDVFGSINFKFMWGF